MLQMELLLCHKRTINKYLFVTFAHLARRFSSTLIKAIMPDEKKGEKFRMNEFERKVALNLLPTTRRQLFRFNLWGLMAISVTKLWLSFTDVSFSTCVVVNVKRCRVVCWTDNRCSPLSPHIAIEPAFPCMS